ncbi:MAG: hypothetical protein NTU98_00620 [Bacteroidetes bacterium]|nr:hypothetical protein [Bacteroidota bacterium]
MAKVDKNSLLNGLTGKLGNETYVRNHNGQKILCRKPGKRNKKKVSHIVMARRIRFGEYARRAKDIIAAPVKRAELQARTKPGQTVYNLAVRELILDYYRSALPTKQKRDLTELNKSAEESDNIKKIGLPLSIENHNGDLIGTGKVILTENGLYWCFTTAVENYLKKKKQIAFRIQIER